MRFWEVGAVWGRMIVPENIIQIGQPSLATFSYTPYCPDKDLDATLKAAFQACGPEVLVLVAADEESVIIQLRDEVRRMKRSSIREVHVYPVLPAKACGHVQLQLEVVEGSTTHHFDLFMCGPYSEALQNWGMEKASQVARLLGVPVKLLEPGHDC